MTPNDAIPAERVSKPTCGVLYEQSVRQFTKTEAERAAFAAGHVSGQAEKVYLGACEAAMFRPQPDVYDGILATVKEIALRYGLTVTELPYESPDSRRREIWISRSKYIGVWQGYKTDSPEWHRLRGQACGIPKHEIDDEFHKRRGYNEPCDGTVSASTRCHSTEHPQGCGCHDGPDESAPVFSPAPPAEPPAAGEELQSGVTSRLIELLRSRDLNGRVKYGKTLDRDDLTTDQWLQHALEEVLDLAGYLEAAKRSLRPATDAEREVLSVTELAAKHCNLQEYLSQLEAELDPPVCRLQFPDGSVPGNAREAAEGWKRVADDLTAQLATAQANLAEVEAERDTWKQQHDRVLSQAQKDFDRAAMADTYEQWLLDIGKLSGCGHVDERLPRCVDEAFEALAERATAAESERDAALAREATLREALELLLSVIGTTPSGFLSIVDDDPTRRAVTAARVVLTTPAASGQGVSP